MMLFVLVNCCVLSMTRRDLPGRDSIYIVVNISSYIFEHKNVYFNNQPHLNGIDEKSNPSNHAIGMYDHHNNDHRAPPSYNGWPFRRREVGRDEERGPEYERFAFLVFCI